MTQRIFLIGFMCSGKTTIGRALAPMLGLPFIDLDREVEKKVGPLLPFIQKNGEAAFRKLETEMLHDLLNGHNAVIATGGGTPCEDDNLERMMGSGTVIWLDVPMPLLMQRIERAGGDRPLLFGLKGEALRERVKDLLAQREPFYSRAQVIVQASAAPEVVARRIVSG